MQRNNVLILNSLSDGRQVCVYASLVRHEACVNIRLINTIIKNKFLLYLQNDIHDITGNKIH